MSIVKIWKTKDETLRPLDAGHQLIADAAQVVYEEAFYSASPEEVDAIGWGWGNKTRRRSTIGREKAREYLRSVLSERSKKYGFVEMYMEHLYMYESDEQTPHCSKHIAVDGM